jgi:integration host factor subunit alpha
MSRKTTTRADLCEAVYRKVGLSRSESAALVELVFKEITDRLEGPRLGRNPKTGKEVPITPRRVMVFKPSAILKQRLGRADEATE